METIDRLESSIHRLSEANRELRKERDDLSRRVQMVGDELESARKNVETLRMNLARYVESDGRCQELEARKNDLKEHIQSIIDKIDKYSDSDTIDSITNG